MKSDFLKKFFDWLREVLETGNLPLVMLILVVMPLIVPAVPAWVTASNLFSQMHFIKEISLIGGLTIELLGFAGAFLVLEGVTDWVKSKNSKTLLTMGINISAYIFYLVATVSINVILDWKAGKDWSYVWVIAILCLLSIPSGMLAATNVSKITERREQRKREQAEFDYNERLRQEDRDEKIRRWNVKHGVVPTQSQVYQQTAEQVKKKKSDWRQLTPDERREVIQVLTIDEIQSKYDVGRSTAFAWKSKTL